MYYGFSRKSYLGSNYSSMYVCVYVPLNTTSSSSNVVFLPFSANHHIYIQSSTIVLLVCTAPSSHHGDGHAIRFA